MDNISFDEMRVLLKSKEISRKDIFKKIRNINEGTVAFVYTDDLLNKKDYLNVKKIYYKYQVKRKLLEIKKDDIFILNKIYNDYINNRLIINDEVKKIIKYYFGKYTNIGRVLAANYYYLSDMICLDKVLRNVIVLDDVDAYLSKVISEKTRNRLKDKGINKISDFKEKIIFLNQIEFSNLACYIEDLKTYHLNDSLFLSILEKEQRELFDSYLECESYKLLSLKLKLSTTEVRARVYTIIKRMLKFFDSVDGIRALDLIFSKDDCFVSIKNLKLMFPKYYRYFLYLVKNKYLYKMELINSLDIIKIK